MTAIDYYIDFKSPAAYLSLGPTLALAAEFPVELVWRPYRTQQRAVPKRNAGESKGETHIRVRARARQQTHLKYAALQGLPMVFPSCPGNSDLALAGLLYARQDPAAYAERAFRAYWKDGRDLNDAEVVRGLLQRSGHAASGFDATACLQQLESEQTPTEEGGVVDTPAYVIDGQVFIGREHLPWIRELLTR